MRNTSSSSQCFNLKKCDNAKAILMLCIIFFHSIYIWAGTAWPGRVPSQPSPFLYFVYHWLNGFQVQAFVFISGYLFYYIRHEKGRYNNFRQDIPVRAKRLLFPFFVVAVLWVIPFHFLFDGGTLQSVLNNFILGKDPQQLWFLPMLFFLFLIFYWLSPVLVKKSVPLVLLCFYFLYMLPSNANYNYFQILRVPYYLVFFYIGMIARQYQFIEKLSRIPAFMYFLLYTGLIAVKVYVFNNNTIPLIRYISRVSTPFIYTIGVLMAITFLGKINYEKLRKLRIFQGFVRYNFTMYLLHQQLIYIVIHFLNHRVSTPVLALSNFLFSVIVSYLLSMLLYRFKITRNLFGIK